MFDTLLSIKNSLYSYIFSSTPAAKTNEERNENGKIRPIAKDKCYVGAWLGDQPREWDPASLSYTEYKESEKSVAEFRAAADKFQRTSGKKPAIVMGFIAANDSWRYSKFPITFLKEVDRMGAVPMVTLEFIGLPFKITGNDTYLDQFNKQFIEKKGDVYEYALNWAKQAKAWGKPMFLRPFHEMNLGENYPWTAWMNGGEAGVEKTKLAWVNLYKLFKDVGADNVNFVWCPSAKSVPNYNWNKISSYYPGDKYVDYVGVDGYRRSEYTVGFDGVFKRSMQDLVKTKKPIIICETSSTPDSGKVKYIDDLFKAAIEYADKKIGKDNKPVIVKANINGIVWFNENKIGSGRMDEDNWLIDAPVYSREESNDQSLKYVLKKKCKTFQDKVEAINAYYDDLLSIAKTKKEKDDVLAQKYLAFATFAFKTEEEKKKYMDEYYRLNPAKAALRSVNPALIAFRESGKEDFFIYGRTVIDENRGAENIKMAKRVKVPVIKSELERSIVRIDEYENKWQYFFPLPSGESSRGVWSLWKKEQVGGSMLAQRKAEAQEKLAGFQIVTDEGIKVKTKVIRQYEMAEEELKRVPKTDRRYLGTLARLKDLYLEWGNESDVKLAECKKVCEEILALLNDKKYIDSFDNFLAPNVYKSLTVPLSLLNSPLSLFNISLTDKYVDLRLDSTFFTESEILGMRTSAYATLGEAAVNEGKRELAEKYYNEANKILSSSYFVEYEKKEKDLIYSIRIGCARLNTISNNDETIKKGIAYLESISYSEDKFSPGIKIKAKLMLADAMSEYAGKAKGIKDEFNKTNKMSEKVRLQQEYDQCMLFAKKAFIIYGELLSSGYGYRAGKSIKELSGKVD